MSDDVKPTPSAAPEQTPASEAAVKADTQAVAARASQSLLSGDPAAEPADDGAPPPSPATWPEDWRERWAGKDEQALKTLKRWASPDNVFKSWMDQRRMIGSGQLQASLPDGASEEEVVAYRKKAGIPDTPDGYGLTFPEGMEPPETAKEQLAAFQAEMHKINAPPRFVGAAWGTYLAMQEADAQRRYEAAQNKLVETKAELRAEYGRDYERNQRIGNQFIAEHGGEEVQDMMKWELSDGTALGAHPAFVRMMINAGLRTAGADTLVIAEGHGGKTIQERIDEGLALQYTDIKKYDSPEHQAMMIKLYEAREAQSRRAA